MLTKKPSSSGSMGRKPSSPNGPQHLGTVLIAFLCMGLFMGMLGCGLFSGPTPAEDPVASTPTATDDGNDERDDEAIAPRLAPTHLGAFVLLSALTIWDG